MSSDDVDVLPWDVALANLTREEYEKKAGPLVLDDFVRLSKDYHIRLDDIMITMFELVIHKHWLYKGEQEITRATLNELYVNGRLHLDDLQVFTGDWNPA